MKKLPLALAAVLTFFTSFYFLSCKKESALIVPAVQKISQEPSGDWKIADKSMLELTVALSQKIKPEYQDYDTDSNIVVACRVKFKELKEERLLPYAIPGFGGTKYYFHTFIDGKLKIHFVNSGVTDFTGGGATSVLPVEEVALNFHKVEH